MGDIVEDILVDHAEHDPKYHDVCNCHESIIDVVDEVIRLRGELATVKADRTWYGRQLHHSEQVRARLQHDDDALRAAAEAHLQSGGMCPFCWAVRIEAEMPHHRADCPLNTTPPVVGS